MDLESLNHKRNRFQVNPVDSVVTGNHPTTVNERSATLVGYKAFPNRASRYGKKIFHDIEN